MRNGDFDQVRKLRKDIERKKPAVQFIAPLSEDGASLQSITLTPSVKSKAVDFNSPKSETQPAEDAPKKGRSEIRRKEKASGIFGFKFRMGPSNH